MSVRKIVCKTNAFLKLDYAKLWDDCQSGWSKQCPISMPWRQPNEVVMEDSSDEWGYLLVLLKQHYSDWFREFDFSSVSVSKYLLTQKPFKKKTLIQSAISGNADLINSTKEEYT